MHTMAKDYSCTIAPQKQHEPSPPSSRTSRSKRSPATFQWRRSVIAKATTTKVKSQGPKHDNQTKEHNITRNKSVDQLLQSLVSSLEVDGSTTNNDCHDVSSVFQTYKNNAHKHRVSGNQYLESRIALNSFLSSLDLVHGFASEQLNTENVSSHAHVCHPTCRHDDARSLSTKRETQRIRYRNKLAVNNAIAVATGINKPTSNSKLHKHKQHGKGKQDVKVERTVPSRIEQNTFFVSTPVACEVNVIETHRRFNGVAQLHQQNDVSTEPNKQSLTVSMNANSWHATHEHVMVCLSILHDLTGIKCLIPKLRCLLANIAVVLAMSVFRFHGSLGTSRCDSMDGQTRGTQSKRGTQRTPVSSDMYGSYYANQQQELEAIRERVRELQAEVGVRRNDMSVVQKVIHERSEMVTNIAKLEKAARQKRENLQKSVFLLRDEVHEEEPAQQRLGNKLEVLLGKLASLSQDQYQVVQDSRRVQVNLISSQKRFEDYKTRLSDPDLVPAEQVHVARKLMNDLKIEYDALDQVYQFKHSTHIEMLRGAHLLENRCQTLTQNLRVTGEDVTRLLKVLTPRPSWSRILEETELCQAESEQNNEFCAIKTAALATSDNAKEKIVLSTSDNSQNECSVFETAIVGVMLETKRNGGEICVDTSEEESYENDFDFEIEDSDVGNMDINNSLNKGKVHLGIDNEKVCTVTATATATAATATATANENSNAVRKTASTTATKYLGTTRTRTMPTTTDPKVRTRTTDIKENDNNSSDSEDSVISNKESVHANRFTKSNGISATSSQSTSHIVEKLCGIIRERQLLGGGVTDLIAIREQIRDKQEDLLQLRERRRLLQSKLPVKQMMLQSKNMHVGSVGVFSQVQWSESKGVYFRGEGTGKHLPRCLRSEGAVKIRLLGHEELRAQISEIWNATAPTINTSTNINKAEGRRRNSNERVVPAPENFQTLISIFFKKKYGLQNAVVKNSYSLLYAAHRYANQDAEVDLFLAVWVGQLPQRTIEVVRDLVVQFSAYLHKINFLEEGGKVDKTASVEARHLVMSLPLFFPHKSKREMDGLIEAMKGISSQDGAVQIKEILKDVLPPKNVELGSSSHTPSDPTNIPVDELPISKWFLNIMKRQYLESIQLWWNSILETCATITSNNGNCTIDVLVGILQRVDKHITTDQEVQMLAWGLGENIRTAQQIWTDVVRKGARRVVHVAKVVTNWMNSAAYVPTASFQPDAETKVETTAAVQLLFRGQSPIVTGTDVNSEGAYSSTDDEDSDDSERSESG